MPDFNAIKVTKQELIAVLEKADEIGAHREGDRSWYFGMVAVAELHRRDPDKVVAIMFRLGAMSRLLIDAGAPGWAIPTGPGGPVLAREELIAAAAVEPLIERENQVVFDRESFLRRALEIAETEGDA